MTIAKKQLYLFLTMFLLLIGTAATAHAATEPKGDCSGSCGPQLTWNYDSDSRTLTIKGIGEMDDYKFSGSPWCDEEMNSEIVKVVVSEGVTGIGAYAFSDFTGMEQISLPSSLDRIGEKAFCYCSSLKDPVLPEGLLYIEDVAFMNCSSIESICLPASLISFGKAVFGDSGIKELLVDENNKYFSAEAGILYNKDKTELIYCTPNLPEKLTVRDSVKLIRESAFSDCITLTEVILPAGLEKIEQQAFGFCFNLRKVILPEKLTEIEDYAFESCLDLTDIKIPAGVTHIGINIFQDCISLKTIEVDPDNKNFCAQDGILYNKNTSLQLL